MFLKNYTSDVPVDRTIARIERTLITCRVSGIMKEYDAAGAVAAIVFRIPAASSDLTVRLPVDEKSAIEALWMDYADGEKLNAAGTALAWTSRKRKSKADFVEQGRRTAWKIMQDWVEVQMSMIQMRQAETLEVFLPYIWDTSSKTTVYGRVKSAGYQALIPERV